VKRRNKANQPLSTDTGKYASDMQFSSPPFRPGRYPSTIGACVKLLAKRLKNKPFFCRSSFFQAKYDFLKFYMKTSPLLCKVPTSYNIAILPHLGGEKVKRKISFFQFFQFLSPRIIAYRIDKQGLHLPKDNS
jgi:hypothetical protein